MTMTTTEIRRGPDPDRLRLVVLAIVLVVAAGVAWQDSETGLPVMAGPTTASAVPSSADDSRRLGGLDGVSAEVEPRVGLLDGDVVEVRVQGLVHLPGATILQCVGDVSEDNAAQVCDPSAVELPSGSSDVPIRAVAEQVVSVSRTIQVFGGSETRFYDCAREPAGCVLAVGPYALPPRAVLVPLEFRRGDRSFWGGLLGASPGRSPQNVLAEVAAPDLGNPAKPPVAWESRGPVRPLVRE